MRKRKASSKAEGAILPSLEAILTYGTVAEIARFIETLPIAVLIAHDVACTRVTGNRASYALLRSPVGKNISKTAPPSEELAIQHTVYRDGVAVPLTELPLQYAAAHAAEVRDAELDLVFADGGVKHISGYAVPLFDSQGQVVGALAAFIDLTE